MSSLVMEAALRRDRDAFLSTMGAKVKRNDSDNTAKVFVKKSPELWSSSPTTRPSWDSTNYKTGDVAPPSSVTPSSSKRSSSKKKTNKGSSSKTPSKRIDDHSYYRLLKKTDVLGHLAVTNDEIASVANDLKFSQEENVELEARNYNLQKQLHHMNLKYDHLSKTFVGHLAALSKVQMTQESLRIGHNEKTSKDYAEKNAEKMLQLDLSNTGDHERRVLETTPTSFFEHSALAKVSQTRLIQLEKVCNAYRHDVAMANVSKSSSIASVLDKNVVLVNEKDEESYHTSLERCIRQMEREKIDLNDHLYQSKRHQNLMKKELLALKERLDESERTKENAASSLRSQHSAMEQYTEDLKSKVKKRFGFVPNSLEYFCDKRFSEDERRRITNLDDYRISFISPSVPLKLSCTRDVSTAWN